MEKLIWKFCNMRLHRGCWRVKHQQCGILQAPSEVPAVTAEGLCFDSDGFTFLKKNKKTPSELTSLPTETPDCEHTLHDPWVNTLAKSTNVFMASDSRATSRGDREENLHLLAGSSSCDGQNFKQRIHLLALPPNGNMERLDSPSLKITSSWGGSTVA